MIHCVDCDDEECDLMPYCLDYQDLLVHMEECTEKKCRMKVTTQFITSRLNYESLVWCRLLLPKPTIYPSLSDVYQ